MLRKNILFYFLMICTYIGLPFLILIHIIPFDYKFYALTIGGIFIYILMRIYGYSNNEMGLTRFLLKKSIIDVLPLTISFLILGIILYFFGLTQRFDVTENLSFFIFYVFISCPIQEFLYRGALNCVLMNIFSKKWIIIIFCSLFYSYVHIIYLDVLTLLLTFGIGVVWHLIYLRTKNLSGVIISHIVLGILTITIGLIN